ncbi:MAG: type II toxin-antitoxin system ParD family antitoxin [Hyphomonadaceae bacterium]
MATRNINLTDTLDRFVAELVASGTYQNASEVVRAGLRLLQAEAELRAKKLAALNAAIQEGIDSGPGIEIEDVDAFFDEMMDEIDAEVEAEEAAARAAAE